MTFGNTPKDSTQIPLGSVSVPGTSNGDLTALQGGPASSDSNSNSSAPVSTYTYSGNFVDFGQTTSSAATTDTGTFTFMAFVKRILQKLTSLVSNTSAFVDNATTGATLQTIGDTSALANGGGQGTWQIDIIPTSTFVGTIIFEGLDLDGTTWGPLTGHLAGSSSMASSSVFTGTGNVTQIWRGNSSTYKQVRARLSAVSVSNATVYVGLSAAPYAVSITNQVQTNLDQVNGTALSSGNPVPTLDTNSAAMLADAAIVAGAVSSNKMATKAASGDFADGALVTLGAEGDTALTNPASSGTLMAFSKGAVKILSDAWDSVNHRLHVFVDNAVALGQATMANSSPVTIASDQSKIPIRGDSTELTGLTATSGVTTGSPIPADLVPSTDVSGYRAASLQVTGSWSGTLTVQQSNDNITFYTVPLYPNGSFTGLINSISVNGVYNIPIYYRYLRVRMTTFTTGPANGVLELFTVPPATMPIINGYVQQVGTWTIQPGNTANTTPWLVKLSDGTNVIVIGQQIMSASLPVTMASDQGPKTSATATRTNVAGANADTALLASNTSRKGAIFYNDSIAILYLAYGSGAASTTSYSVQVAAGGYFELPPEPIYTGAIRGIWASAAGSVRITELS